MGCKVHAFTLHIPCTEEPWFDMAIVLSVALHFVVVVVGQDKHNQMSPETHVYRDDKPLTLQPFLWPVRLRTIG